MGFLGKNPRIEFFTLIVIIVMIVIPIFPTGLSFRALSKSVGDNDFYYSYDQLTDLLNNLENEFPDIFLFYSLGKTYEGRDIWLVKISDNVSIDEDEAEVLFMGGTHGDEKPGYQNVIYSIVSILHNYTSPLVNASFTMRIRAIVNTTELFFIPMVNPDGIEAQTRKNRRINDCPFGNSFLRGVDLNRNYGYKWEEFDKHPLRYIFGAFPFPSRPTIKYPLLDIASFFREGTYRGPNPFSEKESKAIKQFIENRSIVIRIDYHTSGEKIVYPWSWTKESPDDESIFVSIAQSISLINEYQISQGSDWYYTLGCSGDWMYAEHGILPFTIELCKTPIPHYFPSEQFLNGVFQTHLLVNLNVAEQAMILSRNN